MLDFINKIFFFLIFLKIYFQLQLVATDLTSNENVLIYRGCFDTFAVKNEFTDLKTCLEKCYGGRKVFAGIKVLKMYCFGAIIIKIEVNEFIRNLSMETIRKQPETPNPACCSRDLAGEIRKSYV